MLGAIATTDGWVSTTRPAWLWLGQLAVVALGVHLASDRLDDMVTGALTTLPFSWPDPELPLQVATWLALGCELAAVLFAAWCMVRSTGERVDHPRTWLARASVQSVLAPLFWAPTALAGAWVIGMAVEDRVAQWSTLMASPAAWAVSLLVAWRLAGSGLLRVLRHPSTPKRRIDGIAWTPLALGLAWLAVRHGLPIWGWLQ